MWVFQLFAASLAGKGLRLTMKFALVLLLGLAALTSAGPHIQDKRFIVDTFEDIGHWFSSVWNSAKKEVESLLAEAGHVVDFDSLVKQLIPLIDSGATETGCSAACTAGAASLLGPAASLAGVVCGPLCKAALAELEKVAG